ncbi:hypothetical protein LEMLEM_LOCUS21392 [Lemmus lemmus]
MNTPRILKTAPQPPPAFLHLSEQSRGRHGAARAPPRSPPLPARCIVGIPAHRKRSGPPALAWRGDLAARPSVALIPAPACQSPSVAGEAGSASRLPLMGLEGRRFEIDRSRERSWEKRAPLEAGLSSATPSVTFSGRCNPVPLKVENLVGVCKP